MKSLVPSAAIRPTVSSASPQMRRHPDRAERAADGAAGAIPSEGCFHRVLVAEHGKMLLDRRTGNTARLQPLAQPFGVVGQNDIGGAGVEKSLVVPRAGRLIAIGH